MSPRASPAPATPRGAAGLPALFLAGLVAFLNVYVTQPLLPLLQAAFQASTAAAAMTVSATALAVALAAPFTGGVADRFGRRRVIVASLLLLTLPTALAATSGSMGALVAWRFLQGLLVPGVYAVGIAYAGRRWQGPWVGRAMATLVTGNVLGGYLGRLVGGHVAEALGWRAAFLAQALLTLLGALATWRWLPEDADGAGAPGRPAVTLPRLDARLARPRVLATFAVGFAVLFTQVALFTYATWHLSGRFGLGAAALSAVFGVYLLGAVVTPLSGLAIDRVGPRLVLAAALASAAAGALLTLLPGVAAVVTGLAIAASGAFVAQAAATAHLADAAPAELRSGASGLYLSCYYLGGAAGGALPVLAWRAGGWAGCVALVVTVQAAALALGLASWPRPRAARRGPAAVALPARS